MKVILILMALGVVLLASCMPVANRYESKRITVANASVSLFCQGYIEDDEGNIYPTWDAIYPEIIPGGDYIITMQNGKVFEVRKY